MCACVCGFVFDRVAADRHQRSARWAASALCLAPCFPFGCAATRRRDNSGTGLCVRRWLGSHSINTTGSCCVAVSSLCGCAVFVDPLETSFTREMRTSLFLTNNSDFKLPCLLPPSSPSPLCFCLVKTSHLDVQWLSFQGSSPLSFVIYFQPKAKNIWQETFPERIRVKSVYLIFAPRLIQMVSI